MPKKKSGSKAASGSTAKGGNAKTTKKSADIKNVLSTQPSLRTQPKGQHKYDWKDDVIRFYREEAMTAWKCFLAASLERYILSIDMETWSKEVDIVREAMQVNMSFDLSEQQRVYLCTALDKEKDEAHSLATRNENEAAKRFIYGMQAIDSGQPAANLPLIDPKASLQHFLNLVAEGRLPTQPNPPEDDDLNLSFASSTFSEDSTGFLTARSTLNGTSPRQAESTIFVTDEPATQEVSPRVGPSGSCLDRNSNVKDVSKATQNDLKEILKDVKHGKCLNGQDSTLGPRKEIQNGIAADTSGTIPQGNNKKKRQKSGTKQAVANSKIFVENATAKLKDSEAAPPKDDAVQEAFKSLMGSNCSKVKSTLSDDKGKVDKKGATQPMGKESQIKKGDSTKEMGESATDIPSWMSQLAFPPSGNKQQISSGVKGEPPGKMTHKNGSVEGEELSKSDSAIIEAVVADKENARPMTQSSFAFPPSERKISAEVAAPVDDVDTQIEDDERFARELAEVWGAEDIDVKKETTTQSATEKKEVKESHRLSTAAEELPNWAIEGNDRSTNNGVVVPIVQHTRQKTKPFVKIPSLNKTSLCWNYKEGGSCPWGHKCIHAHGKEELRPFPDWFVKASGTEDGGQPHKPKPCEPNHKEPCGDQQCPAQLQFLLRKTSVCKQWQAGRCRYVKSDECKFAHGRAELRKLPKYELCQRNLRGKCHVAAKECVYAHSAAELRVDNSKINRPQVTAKAKGQTTNGRRQQIEEEDSKVWDCIICSDKIQTKWDRVALDCGHDSFHKDCIEQWFQRERTCPYCRNKVEMAPPFSAPRGARASDYPPLGGR